MLAPNMIQVNKHTPVVSAPRKQFEFQGAVRQGMRRKTIGTVRERPQRCCEARVFYGAKHQKRSKAIGRGVAEGI